MQQIPNLGMALPGSWKEVDTNEFKNPVTGDTLKMYKTRQVPSKPSSRKWRFLVNGDDLHSLSGWSGRNTKKEGAKKIAKRKMEKLTVKEYKKKLERKRKLLQALKRAKNTQQDRSSRAKSMDESRWNKVNYDLNDPEEVDRWAKDPGSGDLDMIDSPVGDSKKAMEMLERRIEAVEESIRETEQKLE